MSALTPLAPAYTLEEVQKMAQAIVAGGLFPHLKTPQAAMSLMLLCQAEGLHPMQAVQRYHVVQGRPVMRADAMLAAFQREGGKVEWRHRDAAKVAAVFSHPSGGSVEICWTIEQAKAAGLTGKEVWRQYPRQMLTARVISEGVRTVFPGVCMGLYTPEEAQDFDTKAPAVVVEVSTAPPSAPRPLPTYDQIDAQAAENGGRGKVYRQIEPAKTLGETGEAITAPQLKALGAMGYPGSQAGYPSRQGMTKAQASQLIEYYNRHKTWEGAPGDPGTTTEAAGPAMGNTPDFEDELTDPFAEEGN